MDNLSNIKNRLHIHKQDHLLTFYDDLNSKEQMALLRDVNAIDFDHFEQFHENAPTPAINNGELDALMEPIPTESYGSSSRSDPKDLLKWENAGLLAIAEGKVAVLVLAGGQGTRLGFSKPKGMYDVLIPSNKSLYQVNAEKIRRLQEFAFERTGKRGVITWYIMTSEATMGQTRDFFKEHNYFGLSDENVVFFEQFTLPCVDFNGKVLLSEKYKVACSPDGNGGLYKALRQRKILEDMEKRGIECTHVHCVDNILQKTADPIFLGFCRLRNSDCGAKVVEKTDPHEAVGVVCKVNGVYQVVEYSEISNETSEKRDKDGRLVFNAGNICNHYFTTEFLKAVSKSDNKIPHHIAKKKIPHVDQRGTLVKPTSPNGIKLEKFVFDIFKFAKNFVVFEVNRDDEFSPLKNAEGASSCSPFHARWSLASLHHRQIVKAGGCIVDENGTEIQALTGVSEQQEEYPVQCEISPLLSYDGENLEKHVKNVKLRPPVLLGDDFSKKNGVTE